MTRDVPDRTATARLAVGVLAVGVLGFVSCYVFVAAHWSTLSWMDTTVLRALVPVAVGHPSWVGALRVVEAVLGPWPFRALGLVVAAFSFRRGQRHLAAWLAGAVAGGTLLQWGLKLLVARPRPSLPEGLTSRAGYAFPSGHAFASALVLGALLLLVLRRDPPRRTRVLAWAGVLLLVAVVGFDRLGLGVHHLSDVLAGWFLAVAVLGGAMLGYSGDGGGPAPPPRRDRVGIVLNPAKVEDVVNFRNRLEQRARAAGWQASMWFETTREDGGHAMARAALDAGVQLVVIAGGDGTVRAVCAELAGTGVPVGIVPVGTGNLLARNLGIPLDHEAAMRVAVDGVERRIDVARVDGDQLAPDRFAVMAGLGLDAAIVGQAPDTLKVRMGWPAYVVSAVRNLSFPALSVLVSVDDQPPVHRRAQTVVVGNVGTLTGGLTLLPGARPDDGLLDVVVLAPRALVDWPRLAWRVVRRAPTRDDRLSHWRGRRIVVEAAEPCPRQLDGDLVAPGRMLRVEVDAGALLVRVPAGGAGATAVEPLPAAAAADPASRGAAPGEAAPRAATPGTTAPTR